MEGDAKRKQLLELISNSQKPLSGTALAKRLSVSHQVIVQDIAVLRAGNHAICYQSRIFNAPRAILHIMSGLCKLYERAN